MVKIYLSLLRISIGFVFLWAFLDKLLGLGFSTDPAKSWLSGASPTVGYLKFGTEGGMFANLFQGMSGNPIVDWLFMLGLLGVGVAFVFGIALRFASYSGALMMLLIYLSALPLENNPIIDDHIIYILVLLYLAGAKAGNVLGFGSSWSKSKLVKSFPFLQN